LFENDRLAVWRWPKHQQIMVVPFEAAVVDGIEFTKVCPNTIDSWLDPNPR